ncbi:MAG: MarR family transcriptional regulator [Promethearchaeota archaeon]
MGKEALILKLLLDEIPRTITEIAEVVNISKTYCFELCNQMAEKGAIHFRKSAGTWIAWRKAMVVDISKKLMNTEKKVNSS